jgi:hypothetical protein
VRVRVSGSEGCSFEEVLWASNRRRSYAPQEGVPNGRSKSGFGRGEARRPGYEPYGPGRGPIPEAEPQLLVGRRACLLRVASRSQDGGGAPAVCPAVARHSVMLRNGLGVGGWLWKWEGGDDCYFRVTYLESRRSSECSQTSVICRKSR